MLQSGIAKSQTRLSDRTELICFCWGFPGGSIIKNLPTNAGHADLMPGAGRSPGEGNGNPLQYSCLGNPMDRGGWQATVHGVAKELDKTTK